MKAPSASIEAPEYSAEERAWLLAVARQAIAAGLKGERLQLRPLNAHLAEHRGAFTTLHARGRLRGCVGYIVAVRPLYQTILETAQAAAFEDTRFDPVSAGELAELELEISVLSPFRAMQPEQVVVGRHGLMVSQGLNRGVLLPQVPVEQGWDRETFLAQTCVKAGLQPTAWSCGAALEAFTAEIFGE